MRLRKFSALELLILSTAIGIVATFAAPWVELRGTYAAWRIVEWHTFWRGQDAFQLASVVASNYRVPIEYATADMQATMRNLSTLGIVLGAWHIVVMVALLVVGARWRLRDGATITSTSLSVRAALEILALMAVNVAVLVLLANLLALPSSLTPKVDFRAAEDIHTNSLIWSSVNILPVAPVVSISATLAQLFALGKWLRALHPTNKPSN